MNKTVNINLAGIIFHIEEDAYEQLHAYLQSIHRHFKGTEGQEEILQDIEARIAEIFQQRLEKQRQVVVRSDVDAVIEQMGKPEDFGDAGEEEEPRQSEKRRRGRVYRNPEDQVLGGVCSGISAYLGMDPLWLRLLFALSFFFVGSGILVYILLWIIIPEAKTPAQLLEMRGEPINISNIEKMVNEGFENLKARLHELDDEKHRSKVLHFFERIGAAIASILGFTLSFLGKLLIFVLLLALVTALFVWLFRFPAIFEIGDATLLFPGRTAVILCMTGVALLLLIPLLIILIRLFQVLLGIQTKNTALWISLLVVWLAGLGLCLAVAIQTAYDFTVKQSVIQPVALEQPAADTLYLFYQALDNPASLYNVTIKNDHHTILVKEKVPASRMELHIYRAQGREFELYARKSARAANDSTAIARARHIDYPIRQQGNHLYLPESYRLGTLAKWRNQTVTVTLHVPDGKYIRVDKKLRFFIEEYTSEALRKRELTGRYLMMTPTGLLCPDCPERQANRDTGPEISRLFDFEGFNEVHVSDYLTLDIRQGKESRVKVSGREDALEALTLRQQGEVLYAGMEGYTTKYASAGTPLQLRITLPVLEKLQLSDACTGTLRSWEADALHITMSGASELQGMVDVRSLDLRLSGATQLTLKGQADKLRLQQSGSASLTAKRLNVWEAETTMKGAADADLKVTGSLSARMSGASQLTYRGNPDIRSANVQGGASMRKQ